MKTKKVLYLHGLNSQLHEDRKVVLEKYNLDIFAPILDYENDPTIIGFLLQDFQADFIIGSSAGGLVGYYISGIKQVPALLFNPALHYRHQIKEIENLPVRKTRLQIVLGAQDDVVPAIDTFNYTTNHLALQSSLIIHWQQNIGHRIPIEIFEEEVACFIRNLS